MRALDVNILIPAYLELVPQHEQYAEWLRALLEGDEPFGMSELVLSAFLRIVTNPAVVGVVADSVHARSFVDVILERPSCVRLRPGERNWTIFRNLCVLSGVRGPDVADAYHAALVIEHDCELITDDRGFARFPGLRWSHPFA